MAPNRVLLGIRRVLRREDDASEAELFGSQRHCTAVIACRCCDDRWRLAIEKFAQLERCIQGAADLERACEVGRFVLDVDAGIRVRRQPGRRV
jgi:hypothetical protein